MLSLALMLLVMSQSHYICSLLCVAGYKLVLFPLPASAKILRIEIGRQSVICRVILDASFTQQLSVSFN